MSFLGVLKMTPESFADNSSINVCIQECLQYFEGADRSRIERELRSDARAKDKSKFLHTFRELIFGSYLSRTGCRVRPYQEYNGDKPDWSAFGERGDLLALIDVMNFHPLQAVEAEIRRDLAKGDLARPKIDIDVEKLSEKFCKRLQEKCTAYTGLVQSLNVPYLVGAPGEQSPGATRPFPSPFPSSQTAALPVGSFPTNAVEPPVCRHRREPPRSRLLASRVKHQRGQRGHSL